MATPTLIADLEDVRKYFGLEALVNCVVGTANLILHGAHIRIDSYSLDFYKKALADFLMSNPDNPISKKYPDAGEVVEAYRVIESYIDRMARLTPSNP